MRLTMIGGAVSALVVCGVVLAGDLNPPPGPVAGTMKSLEVIEPRLAIGPETTPGDSDSVFRLSRSGSYYLTGDVIGEVGKQGIEVAASDIRIDLNGFVLRGVPGSLDGVGALAPITDITIVNGTVRGWGGDGIDLSSGGERQRVIGVGARLNGGTGIVLYRGGLVESCSGTDNGDRGIEMIFGDGVIRDSVALRNGTTGISAGAGSVVTACVSRLNGADGFVVSEGVVSGCTSRSNTGSGFFLGVGSVAESCDARSNGAEGFECQSEATVRDCDASGNLRGITVGRRNRIVENRCDGNSLAGILALAPTEGAGSRIEGNTLVANGLRGIEINASGCLVIGNSVSGSPTGYVILGANTVGPIVDGASILTDDSPHANYSH